MTSGSNNNPILEASNTQGGNTYTNIDNFTNGTIKKGTLLAKLGNNDYQFGFFTKFEDF